MPKQAILERKNLLKEVVFISTYRSMLSEQQRLEKELKEIQQKLQKLPEGNFFYTHNGTYSKWYLSDGHSQTYIPKSQKEYASQLAMRKFLLSLEKEDQKELKALQYYFRHSAGDDHESLQKFMKDPVYQELLSTYFQPLIQELLSWMNSPYSKNQKYPEQLSYKTREDEYVRSKSEALIAMCLMMNRIPYRYECELKLEDITVYPDFTIRHPLTGEVFYWEHFGMVDIPSYAKNVADKTLLYMHNGIYPEINLICSYETKDHPLDTQKIQNMISFYFGEREQTEYEK